LCTGRQHAAVHDPASRRKYMRTETLGGYTVLRIAHVGVRSWVL
jgi:hypothetical protein